MPDETRPPDQDRAADEGVASPHETIPLAEERARVDKRAVEREAAVIRLRTRTEDVPVDETLRRETAEIERRAVDLVTDELPRIREEEGVTIVPVVEEVLVRRFRVIEELHIRRHAEDVAVRETVTLRRQEARIDHADPADPDPGAPSSGRPGDEGPA